MLDGNVVRMNPDHSHLGMDRRMSDQAATGHGDHGPEATGEAKVAQVIAEGLMVLPPDNGVPPLLRRRNHVPVDPLAARTPPAQPPPPAIEEPVKPATSVVTPHPAVFRSRATPLAKVPLGGPQPRTKPAEPPPPEMLDIEPPPLQPEPEAAIDENAGVFQDDSAVMQEFAREFARPVAAPPSLESIRNMFRIPQPEPASAPGLEETAPEAEAPAPAAPPPAARPSVATNQHAQPAAGAAAQDYAARSPHYPQPGQVPQSHVPQGYAQQGYGQPSYPPMPYGMPNPMHMQQPVPGWYGYAMPQTYPTAMPAYAMPQHYPAMPPLQQPQQQTVSPGAQLMQGLLQYLPPPGSVWPAEERARWLEAASTLFDLAYGNLPGRNRQ